MRRLIALVLCLISLLFCSALADAKENQEIIYTYLTETLSLSRAAACGILANIKAESGFRPEAVGDNGNAYGICQWNSRRQSLVKYCEENGYESWQSLEGQLGYLAHELETNKKSVGAYLRDIPDTAQGAYDAAWYFCVYYEIPGNRYDKGVTRGKTAVNTFYKQYGGSIASYTVRYDANGGSAAPAAGTKTEGVPFAVTSAVPVRAGYQLAGWSEDKSGKGTVYQAGDNFTENRDTTLYAVWERSADAGTPADAVVALDGHIYEYYSGAFSWARAQEFAAAKGGYLASVRTEAEYAAVCELTAQADGPCWLGAKYTSGNWTWLTGESFSDSFAAARWQADEPAATVGASDRGCLAQTPDGRWIDLSSGSMAPRGVIVEYGSPASEPFPVYAITVTTSLRLREGPGTSYASLGYLYPGMLITIKETSGTGSSMWGWGIAGNGLSGWCSMKPAYMTPLLIDEETGLTLREDADGLCVLSLSRPVSFLDIPAAIGNKPVTAIASGAFTGPDAPVSIAVPESVTAIESGTFSPATIVFVPVGSAAHAAAAADGCAIELILPEEGLRSFYSLTAIRADAFRGDQSLRFADFSLAPLASIDSGAFRGCDNLRAVMLGASVSFIADDAFDPGIIIVCLPGSYADRWARSHYFISLPCAAE